MGVQGRTVWRAAGMWWLTKYGAAKNNFPYLNLDICQNQRSYMCMHVNSYFKKGCQKKKHATICKGIVGGFEFTVLQIHLQEWHERPWNCVCDC